MNKSQFQKQFLCDFTKDVSYEAVLHRVRFDKPDLIAKEMMYRIETQRELESRIEKLIVQRSLLHEHIENLKKLSSDYCMCGSSMKSHHAGNHQPISEFDYYLQSNGL